MVDLTRVRTRWGSDPHYVNVDLDYREVGSLVLSGYGEVVKSVVHDEEDDEQRQLVDEILRLAQAIASAAASCASTRH